MLTATTCTVITRRGVEVQTVDDEAFSRKTVEIKPWKIRHVLEEMRTAAQNGGRK